MYTRVQYLTNEQYLTISNNFKHKLHVRRRDQTVDSFPEFVFLCTYIATITNIITGLLSIINYERTIYNPRMILDSVYAAHHHTFPRRSSCFLFVTHAVTRGSSAQQTRNIYIAIILKTRVTRYDTLH